MEEIMGYEVEEIRQSQEIFYYLLEHHELQEEKEQLLYRAYTEQEKVQSLVKSQGEIALCSVERYGNVIYLIPREENNFLGFSKAQLKSVLCNRLMQIQRHGQRLLPVSICDFDLIGRIL